MPNWFMKGKKSVKNNVFLASRYSANGLVNTTGLLVIRVLSRIFVWGGGGGGVDPKKCLEPRSGEKNFLSGHLGLWGHAPPESLIR